MARIIYASARVLAAGKCATYSTTTGAKGACHYRMGQDGWPARMSRVIGSFLSPNVAHYPVSVLFIAKPP